MGHFFVFLGGRAAHSLCAHNEINVCLFIRLYHLMAWGVPLVMASLPLLKGYYGPAGAWW